MPTYEYKCQDCKKIFTIIQSISDHGKATVSCPNCKSTKAKKVISIFTAKTSKKS
jgi:putative FmdB family regulatory protein